jgi:translation initiation factor 2B subunit (eIF-2B alpha/beta/delta family)
LEDSVSDPRYRLDRIERKLDQISDGVLKIGVIEERLQNRDEGMRRLGQRVDDLDERLRRAEQSSWSQASAIDWVKAIVFMALSAVLGWTVSQMK